MDFSRHVGPAAILSAAWTALIILSAFCLRGDNMMYSQLDASIIPFAIAGLLLAALASGLLCALLGLRAFGVGPSLLFSALGFAGVVSLAVFPDAGGWAAVASFACMGAALAGFAFNTVIASRMITFPSALIALGISMCLAFTAVSLAKAWPNGWVEALTMACSCVIAGLCSVFVARRCDDSGLAEECCDDSSVPFEVWMAITGLAFNFLTFGLTFVHSGADSEPMLGIKPAVCLVLLAVIAVWVRSSKSDLSQAWFCGACRVLLPIAAAIMLVCPFLDPYVSDSMMVVFALFSYGGIALFNLLGVAGLAYIARAGGSRAYAMVGGCIAGVAACMLVGACIQMAWGSGGQVVSLCILAFYLVALVIKLARGASKPQPVAGQSDNFDAICEGLTQDCGLSAREAEVLRYAARGRGAKYIAEQLSISPETVRTHQKRIYDKLSVHSKEELLDRIEACAAEATDRRDETRRPQ